MKCSPAPARPASPSSGSAHRDQEEEVLRGEAALHAVPPSAHIVLDPGAVPLVSCMNAAAAMVTDVSSVLTDFLPSDKPVAVCDPRGRDREKFVALFPTAAAATVLPPELPAVTTFLEVAGGRHPDVCREARATVRRRVLGPPGVSPTLRFDAAVTRLAQRARIHDRFLGTGQEENQT
mgnify:CR=1 FL=1